MSNPTPSERSRKKEIRERAGRAAELSGWLYDDYDGGTDLEVLAGWMAMKDIPYLLDRLARVDPRYLRHLRRCEDYAVEQGYVKRTDWESESDTDTGGEDG